MSIQFLSFTEGDIPQEKIIAELLPDVNKFILDMYNVKKQITEKIENPNERQDIIAKFKLIVDLSEIYKNPNTLRMIKEYQDEKERERKRAAEIELRRQEMLRSPRRDNGDFFDGGLFNFWNNRNNNRNNDDVSDDDINSDVSENEYHQDQMDKMLSRAYTGIKRNSTLRKIVGVERSYVCEIEKPTDQPDDQAGDQADDQSGDQSGEQPDKQPDGQSNAENNTTTKDEIINNNNQPLGENNGVIITQ